MTTYPALTIWQPWASLIAAGCKPFEFRGWPAPLAYHGRRIAIHAGARAIHKDEMRDLVLRLQSSHWRETGLLREPALALLTPALTSPGILPRSAILCLTTLGTPIRDAELAEQVGIADISDSDRDEHSNWGWPLTDIERLEPYIPARGAQGFWTWTRSEP